MINFVIDWKQSFNETRVGTDRGLLHSRFEVFLIKIVQGKSDDVVACVTSFVITRSGFEFIAGRYEINKHLTKQKF